MPHTEENLGMQLPSQNAPVGVTVGASPFDYVAPSAGLVLVTGGTVTVVSLGRNGTFTGVGIVAGIVPVSRKDTVRVTYAVLPTMTFLRQ